ncbi:uncharacterized protein AMSG_05949 [Thecamonas trahens ATCC 50062]|uniref:Uncharacterized protein n=1 Tax=Thecamonas trahens ATCC 50062 TaxID=461836 RepID=A0A0L0DED6_THETB|nr:hypothetical protein AMSG_05949 [Thecamonas trahens ATCC 50062]KNC49688.1 hypothetical protein AMSG_05949 [Thecamonas trahens ATCC 50062]|eukprot:XP_013757484.1 hypothetical protein AMSG_05949 [Thecamonas trahens ATCC 50062]
MTGANDAGSGQKPPRAQRRRHRRRRPKAARTQPRPEEERASPEVDVLAAKAVAVDGPLADELAALGKQYSSSAAAKAHLDADHPILAAKYYASKYHVPQLTSAVEELEANNTFQPKISDMSAVLAAERRQSPPRSRANAAVRDALAHATLNNCSFSPEINPRSQDIAADADALAGKDKYRGAARTTLMYQLGQEWADRRAALEATVKRDAREAARRATPQTNRRKADDDHRDFLERSRAWAAAKEDARIQRRRKALNDAAKADADLCTFRPAINRIVPPAIHASAGPDIMRVSGAAQFLHRYSKAREQAKLRAKAVTNPSRTPVGKLTPEARARRRRWRAAEARRRRAIRRPVGYRPLLSGAGAEHATPDPPPSTVEFSHHDSVIDRLYSYDSDSSSSIDHQVPEAAEAAEATDLFRFRDAYQVEHRDGTTTEDRRCG